MLVELDTRHGARHTVSLECDRITDETTIVVGEAFRRPFRYAP